MASFDKSRTLRPMVAPWKVDLVCHESIKEDKDWEKPLKMVSTPKDRIRVILRKQLCILFDC